MLIIKNMYSINVPNKQIIITAIGTTWYYAVGRYYIFGQFSIFIVNIKIIIYMQLGIQ